MRIKVKAIYQTFRSSEWWEYKISPILAISYATSINLEVPISTNIAWVLFLMFSIIIGAIFVSTINDITDIDDDLASGKSNRMVSIRPKYRWVIPAVGVSAGIFCLFVIFPDYFSAGIYILPWIAYSMYSVKPIRLKERGFAGILADASGAHLFISIFIISSLSYVSDQPIDWLWFGMIAAWALIFGIRGILWHQFDDRENDLLTKTKTFATTINPISFKKFEIVLFGLEIMFFSGILIKLIVPSLFILLILYIIVSYLRYRCLNYKPVLITYPKNSSNQILMLDFYIVFFPIGLLLHSAFFDQTAWVIGGIHIILFHGRLIAALKDMILIAKLGIAKTLRTSL